MTNHTAKRYLKEVLSHPYADKSFKKALKSQLTARLESIAEADPAITLEALYVQVGTPEEVIKGFCDHEDYEKMVSSERKKSALWMVIGVIALILMMSAIALAIWLFKELGGTYVITEPLDSVLSIISV